jgi:hypothetical protein
MSQLLAIGASSELLRPVSRTGGSCAPPAKGTRRGLSLRLRNPPMALVTVPVFRRRASSCRSGALRKLHRRLSAPAPIATNVPKSWLAGPSRAGKRLKRRLTLQRFLKSCCLDLLALFSGLNYCGFRRCLRSCSSPASAVASPLDGQRTRPIIELRVVLG